MRLGIDFGTTRIVVAAADRGNFPLLHFESSEANSATSYDWFPPLVAIRNRPSGVELRYGWRAWESQGEPDWTVVRSLKRYLQEAGPNTLVTAGGTRVPLREVLTGLTATLAAELRLRYGREERLEVMLGVPANANSNQRFLTVDAFRASGFEVLGLLNEPSAASIEFGHRRMGNPAWRKGKEPSSVLVYDLGGGTFDASLVEIGETHTVVATEGISTLGGDDFDRILAEMAIEEDQLDRLSSASMFRLEEECRRQKEALHPNSRRIVLDLDLVQEGLGQVTIPVAEFYERCRPLLEATIRATSMLAARSEIDVLYVTGGGSELPVVARILREEFGRKVRRSEYTRSATAIGLAIQAGATTNYRLHEVFTRHFGVWRERDSGETVAFDPIFEAGTRLPSPGDPPVRVVRQYAPAHNIGHFRYLEASATRDDGQPSGDIAVWDEIQFPFEPALVEAGPAGPLGALAIARSDAATEQRIEECYSCDATGSVSVTIRNLTSGYGREFRLARWQGGEVTVAPGARRKPQRA